MGDQVRASFAIYGEGHQLGDGFAGHANDFPFVWKGIFGGFFYRIFWEERRIAATNGFGRKQIELWPKDHIDGIGISTYTAQGIVRSNQV